MSRPFLGGKMKKTALSCFILLLSVALAFGSLTTSASAKELFTESHYTYSVSSAGEATIVDVNDNISGNVNIPEELGGYPVTAIGESAFENCSYMTGVMIPPSISYIGEYAFAKCTSLTEFVYNATEVLSNNKIFDEGISGSQLTVNLVVGPLVTTIPERMFMHSRIGNIDFTNAGKCTSIGKEAFYDCIYLGSVALPTNLNTIGDGAFNTCIRLEKVTFNSKLKTIESFAFSGCINLRNPKLPSSLLIINPYAFYSCSSITSINIPDSVLALGNNAFKDCSAAKHLFIGNGIEDIRASAFSGCTNLLKVLIPDSVTNIEASAFENCESLQTVIFNQKLTTLGHLAFANCKSLQSIDIPDSVTDLGTATFSGCSSLETVFLGNGVTRIGYGTFSGCASLTSVLISENVTEIEYQAFSECNELKKVYINSPELIKKLKSLDDCEGLFLNVQELCIEESCRNKLANSIIAQLSDGGTTSLNGKNYYILRTNAYEGLPELLPKDEVETVTPPETGGVDNSTQSGNHTVQNGMPSVEYSDGVGCSAAMDSVYAFLSAMILCAFALALCRKKVK